MQDEQLFPVIYSFHPWRNRCQYLIRYCFEFVGQLAYRQFFAKDDNRIALLGIGVGDVDHASIHTNIADYRTTFSGDGNFTSPVTEMTVEAIGIADWDDGDA